MTSYFLDSSALAKLYHREIGSDRVDQINQETGRRLLISRLSVVEMQSVLAGKQRAGLVTPEDAEALRRRFVADVGSQAIEVVSLVDQHFTAAEAIIRRYATEYRLRTLDALQLAVALSVMRSIALDYFVSADRVLCTAAAREGLNAVNPDD